LIKKHWKTFANTIFLILVFAATLWSVFQGENLKQVFRYFRYFDPVYLIPCVLCVLAFILLESVIIFYLAKKEGTRVRLSHCCFYSFIGFFYSAITPSASGGQPMQLIYMRRDNIPTPVATIILAIVTITYKLVLVLFGGIILLLRPTGIMRYLTSIEWWIYIGIGLNILCIAGLFFVVFHPGIVRALATWFFRLMHRIRPPKHPEKQGVRLERLLEQYNGTAEFYKKNPHVVLHVLFITILQRCCLFAVTWLTYRAFHLSGESFLTILVLQAMISVAVDMLPLPGGMGISENLFLLLFLPLFGETLILPGMIISRGISYYTQLLISGIMTIVAGFILKDKRKE